MRAAAILGRIIDVLETIEDCSNETLERARGLLVAELQERSVIEIRTPHQSRRRNAVLTAALACVQAEPGHRAAHEADPPSSEANGAGTRERRAEAWQVLYRVHRVLDGVVTFHDQIPTARGTGVDELLAHMLRGSEPLTWRRDQHDFARCVLECMRSPER